jgi:Fe-S cluster assembly scaffold protein SufB
MLINTNKINASHEVNIGSINKEKKFYLMSKGMSEKESINLLLKTILN